MILVNDNSGNVNPCWRSGRPHGKVKDTTVVFLMNDFNPLTLQLWSQTSEVSALLQSLLFTYTQHLVKCFSSTVNPIAATALLLRQITFLSVKNI